MKKRIVTAVFSGIASLSILYACTKDRGINPDLAFSDRALYDSCRNLSAFTHYKNDPAAVYSGVHGPHGAFKLRFNKVAYAALTDNGKLPAGKSFPNGSLIVKDIQSNGQYALMYKKTGAGSGQRSMPTAVSPSAPPKNRQPPVSLAIARAGSVTWP